MAFPFARCYASSVTAWSTTVAVSLSFFSFILPPLPFGRALHVLACTLTHGSSSCLTISSFWLIASANLANPMITARNINITSLRSVPLPRLLYLQRLFPGILPDMLRCIVMSFLTHLSEFLAALGSTHCLLHPPSVSFHLFTLSHRSNPM